jgi:hypothetical protein
MYGQSFRLSNEAIYIFRDVVASHRRYLSFEFQLAFDLGIPLGPGEIGNIGFITEKIVDDQYLGMIDLFFDRLVPAKSAFIVGKGQLFRFGWPYSGI